MLMWERRKKFRNTSRYVELLENHLKEMQEGQSFLNSLFIFPFGFMHWHKWEKSQGSGYFHFLPTLLVSLSQTL